MMPAIPKPQSRAAQKKTTDREKERRWQQVRREVLERDEFRCRFCKVRGDADVHHLKPRSLGREDSTRNCLVLCRIHHADRHAGRLYIFGDDANKTLRFQMAPRPSQRLRMTL